MRVSSAQPSGSYQDYTTVFGGFSADPPILAARYLEVPGTKMVHVYIAMDNGTSNANIFTLTLPFAAANTSQQLGVIRVTNNGVNNTGRAGTTANSTILTLFPSITAANNAWTTSGLKAAGIILVYERA